MTVYIVYVYGKNLYQIGNVYTRKEEAEENVKELQSMFSNSFEFNVSFVEKEVKFGH